VRWVQCVMARGSGEAACASRTSRRPTPGRAWRYATGCRKPFTTPVPHRDSRSSARPAAAVFAPRPVSVR
jgi:hypothetical protein